MVKSASIALSREFNVTSTESYHELSIFWGWNIGYRNLMYRRKNKIAAVTLCLLKITIIGRAKEVMYFPRWIGLNSIGSLVETPVKIADRERLSSDISDDKLGEGDHEWWCWICIGYARIILDWYRKSKITHIHTHIYM